MQRPIHELKVKVKEQIATGQIMNKLDVNYCMGWWMCVEAPSRAALIMLSIAG